MIKWLAIIACLMVTPCYAQFLTNPGSGGGGGGSGTVTSVSVTPQNGVSAVVTNPTTTPALAFTLGAITPSSISTGGQITSTLATGTAPLVITSTTLVPNLYVARAVLADSTTTNANLTGDVTSVGNATTLVTAQPGAHTWAAAQTINLNAASAPAAVTGTALQVIGADSVIGRVQATSFGAIASLTAARANGTGASPTAILSGDQIGGFNAYSYVTSASPGFVGPIASYQTYATQNHTTTAMGSRIIFATIPNNSTTLTTALTVDQDQSATLVGRLTAAGFTNTANGAASVSSSIFTGTLFTGGTATTTFPQMLFQPTGTTAVASWATTGTVLGFNVSASTANIIDAHVAGAGSIFSVGGTGNVNIAGTGYFGWGGSTAHIKSGGQDATLQILNNAETAGTLLTVPTSATLQMGGANVVSGANAQTLTFQGNTGSTTNGPLALIRGAGGGSSTSVGGELRLSGGLPSAAAGTSGPVTAYTAPTGSGITPVLAFQVDAAGAVKISKGFTVSTLPTAGTAGRYAYVTDQLTTCAAAGAALVGGGALTCPVFDNGSAWVGG